MIMHVHRSVNACNVHASAAEHQLPGSPAAAVKEGNGEETKAEIKSWRERLWTYLLLANILSYITRCAVHNMHKLVLGGSSSQ